ncbi:MAG: aminopeptidase P family protein [Ruminococcaceae bacterium]|nr:aminopeptidase P family protein [Oscillospiraceae bacterium]
MMNYFDLRIEKLREKLPPDTALLVTDDISRRYFSGFASSAGYMYISKNCCVLALDFRYFEKAKIAQTQGKMSKDVQLVEANISRKEIVCKLIEKDNTTHLLYENCRTTCKAFEGLKNDFGGVAELVPAENMIELLRAQKDEHELSRIVEAQRITDLGFDHICRIIKRGMTENEIALELEFFMRKNGASGLAFSTICVSGAKSSMPHGEPDETVVSDGFLTLDFGASFDGYCSDMTRTLCVGKPTAEMLRIYDTVLAAQDAAFSKIHGGVVGKEVDAAARDLIYGAGYEGCFGHSTGHSLGLEIHECPNFSPREESKIPSGAVLSVEPGIYVEGKCGVRIEDIVFLTENGYKNLTNSTKDIIIL